MMNGHTEKMPRLVSERLKKLNRIAIEQMEILGSDHNLKRLEGGRA